MNLCSLHLSCLELSILVINACIFLAMSLQQMDGGLNVTNDGMTHLGSMLFTRCVSGAR